VPSRSDIQALWDKEQARKDAETAAATAHHQQIRNLVGLKIEDLLADSAWGVYQQHVTDLKARAQRVVEASRAQFDNPAVTHLELETARLHGAFARGMVLAFEQALALPESLKTV
jgi:hypothetical protein